MDFGRVILALRVSTQSVGKWTALLRCILIEDTCWDVRHLAEHACGTGRFTSPAD